MSETIRRMKANRSVAERPCAWCAQALMLGDDAVLCTECSASHHAACWDEKGGCAGTGCAQAPLKQMEAPAAKSARPMGPHQMTCPHCGRRMAKRARVCVGCKMAPTPDGLYRGPTVTAPAASTALTYAIVGIFFFGPIFGAMAIKKALDARGEIERDPTLEGGGKAMTALVIGIFDVVIHVGAILVKVVM